MRLSLACVRAIERTRTAKAFFNNAVVKQVDVPTLAGMVGVLANHVPTIGVLKPGVVSVTDNEGNVTKALRLLGHIVDEYRWFLPSSSRR
ncbi:ATP synthase, delta/epsilon subunit, beta-sandwich domain protein, partial [Ostertagia ostertagi]